MNIIAIVILSTLIIDYLLGLLSDGFNLKHMTSTIPEEFQDVVDKELDLFPKPGDFIRQSADKLFVRPAGFAISPLAPALVLFPPEAMVYGSIMAAYHGLMHGYYNGTL